jgi:hypothetical protein
MPPVGEPRRVPGSLPTGGPCATGSSWSAARSSLAAGRGPPYAVAKRPADFWVGLVTPALVALFVGLLLFLLGLGRLSDQIDQQLPDWAHWLVAVVPAGSIVSTLLFVMSGLFKVVQPVSARILDYVRLPDYREETGYQNWLIDDLTFLRKRVGRARARGRRRSAAATVGQPRVVVFIDDLDRCSDEHVMEILQAINLILGASDYFVFLGSTPT